MGRGHGAKPESVRQRFVEVMANPEYATNRERIEAVGISEAAFYNWLKDADVKKEIDELIALHTDSELSSIWQALVYRCKAGDVKAIKLFMELKDKYVSRVEQNGEITISIKVEE